MNLVGLYRQEKPADEDDDVAETGDECNQPHADSENNAVEKMGYAADTVPSRIADAYMKSQGTHVEIVKIAVKLNKHINKLTTVRTIIAKVIIMKIDRLLLLVNNYVENNVVKNRK